MTVTFGFTEEARRRQAGLACSILLHAFALVLLLAYRPDVPATVVMPPPPLETIFIPPPLSPPAIAEAESRLPEGGAAHGEEAPVPPRDRPGAPTFESFAAPAAPDLSPAGTASGDGVSPGDGSGGSGAGDGAGSGSGTGAGAGAGDFVPAEWIVRPTAAEMDAHYPRLGAVGRHNGIAMLSCFVDARNRARRCRLVREAPRRYGFGRAALRMTHLFRIRPPLRNGQPQHDMPVRVTIDFVIR